MNRERNGFGLVASNGRLYAVGGDDEDTMKTVEMYNPE